MVEKVTKINNPLTIIAIFATLAEVNATVSIGLIDKSLHHIFIWFIIGFPTLLIILFFLTLNFKTKAMYSPSDYREDKNFIESMYGNNHKTNVDVNDKITIILEELENKLITSIDKKINIAIDKSSTLDKTELKTFLETYKTEVKVLSEEAIKKSSGIDFDMPISLRNEIIRWVNYPAFLPLIYAIVKEKISSVSKLSNYKDVYYFRGDWENRGLTGLKNIIEIDGDSIKFVGDVKLPLEKWIKLNEKNIKKIISTFSILNNNDAVPQSIREELKNLAQLLIF